MTKQINKVSWIGWMVRLKVPMLGCRRGAIGFVFNEYGDFDDPGDHSLIGIQVIFWNGNYDGFSVVEQRDYLEFVKLMPRYAGYKFTNVMRVSRDYRLGFWDFKNLDDSPGDDELGHHNTISGGEVEERP